MNENKKELIRAFKFLIFSISAGLIQTASFTLLFEVAGFTYWPAYLIAVTLSVIFNFTINRKFTFKSANNVTVSMLLVALFYVAFIPLSTWGGDYLTSINWNEYLVLAITMVLNFILEFLYTRFIVYRNSVDTKIDKKVIEQ